MDETITIKPSIKKYIPPFLLLAFFCSFIIFFSILIFEKQVNFVLPILIVILIALIFILVFAPTVLFERLMLNRNYLIHKTLLKTEVIEIAKIKSIHEEMPYKRGNQLVFASPKEKIRIIFQIYPEQDLKRFLAKLLELNPKIANEFDTVELNK